MTNAYRCIRTSLGVLGLAVLTLLCLGDPVQAQVIGKVTFENRPDGHEIRVNFNSRLQYVAHAPKTGGEVLRIELRPIGGAANGKLAGREAKGWKPTRDVPLSQISYDGTDPKRPSLTFRFSHSVRFQVRGSRDQRGVLVTILPDQRAGKSRAQSPSSTRTAQGIAGTTQGGPSVDLSHPYVINLESQLKPHDPTALPRLKAFARYRLYTTTFVKDGKTWHRLRLGFFPTKRAAREVAQSLLKRYPELWITRAPEAERRQSKSLAIGPFRQRSVVGTARPAPTPKPSQRAATSTAGRSAISRDKLADLMAEAKKAMTAGDISRAILLYTSVLEYPDHEFRPAAQELLGLARERKGQYAQAQAAYETYLQLYPDGEGADRVRQRLAGLVTATAEPPKKLRQAEQDETPDRWRFDTYGSVFQFYTRDDRIIANSGLDERVQRSELTSDLDLNVRARNSSVDLGMEFVGGYLASFIDETDDEFQISTLALDVAHPASGLSGRAGRQTMSTNGVLGRFDGGLLSYQVMPQIKLNAVGGFPVESTTSTSIDTDLYFYGLGLDLGTFFDYWELNVYAIQQIVDDITDRRAVGGEIHFFHPNSTILALVDYDILYNELNIGLATATLNFPDHTTVNLGFDYRKSPFLTTRNALVGQTVDNIDALLDLFSESEVRRLAEDRTADLYSATLGFSRPFSEKFQFSADVAATKLTDTEASGGVAETPGTGFEFFYSAQLIGNSLHMDGDITILGLQFSDADLANTVGVTLNSQFPVTRSWFVNPRMTVNYRWNENDDGKQVIVRPAFRSELLWRAFNLRLELEAGVDWINQVANNQADNTVDYFVTVGYRLDF